MSWQMRKPYTFLTILIIMVSISFYACQHKSDSLAPGGTSNGGNPNNGGTGGGGNNGGGTQDTGICFQRDILPIFVSNCAKSGCHDLASHQEGFVFDSWEHITSKEFVPGNANATELYEKITEDKPSKIMPPPPNAPLTQEQIRLIRNWINMGAPNTVNCFSGCDSNEFSYSGAIKPILDNNCKGCHNNTLMSGGNSFETYTSTIAVVNSGRFLGAIKHQSGYSAMPKGGVKLSDCQIMKIEKWIASGTPND